MPPQCPLTVPPSLADICLLASSTPRSPHGLDISRLGRHLGSQQKGWLVRGIPRPPVKGPLRTPLPLPRSFSSSRLTTGCKYRASCPAHGGGGSSSPIPWLALTSEHMTGAEWTAAGIAEGTGKGPRCYHPCWGPQVSEKLLCPLRAVCSGLSLPRPRLCSKPPRGPLPKAPTPRRAGVRGKTCRIGLRRATLGTLFSPSHTLP